MVAKPNGRGKPEEKPLGMVLLPGCRCRCGHEWLPRGEERPAVCPKCKSPRWDKPKRYERKPPSEGEKDE